MNLLNVTILENKLDLRNEFSESHLFFFAASRSVVIYIYIYIYFVSFSTIANGNIRTYFYGFLYACHV